MIGPGNEPLFRGTNNTNSVNLGLTSLCTMKCPNCCCAIPEVKADGTARHATIAEIVRDAVHMQGLKRIHLSGGEPTMHPEFEIIARNVRDWFNCELVTIESNGTGYKKYRHLFANPILFDRVFITHYVKDQIYPGNYDSSEVIELAIKDCGDRLLREPPVVHSHAHEPLTIIGQEIKPCSRWFDPGLPAAWYNGMLYSCCVSFGIDRTLCIPVTPDWREKIKKLDMGCNRCLRLGT